MSAVNTSPVLHVNKIADVTCKEWQCSKSLVQCLDHLFTYSLYTDVTFLLGWNGEDVKAHSFILKARSPVFCKLLNAIESQQWKISLFNYSKQTMTKFLRYIYTDEVTLTNPDALSLIGVARQFKVNTLVSLCEVYLQNNSPKSKEDVTAMISQDDEQAKLVQNTKTCKIGDKIGSVPPEVQLPSKQNSVDGVSSALPASKCLLKLKRMADERPKSEIKITSVPESLRHLLKNRQSVDSTTKMPKGGKTVTLDGSVMMNRRCITESGPVMVRSLLPVSRPGSKQQHEDGVLKQQHEGSISKPHEGSVLKQQHEGSISKPHEGSVLKQHEGGVSKQHERSVSKHEDSVSKLHEGSVSKPHEGSVSKQQHEGSVSKQQHEDGVSKQHEGSVSKQQHGDGVSKQQHEDSISKQDEGSVSKQHEGGVSKQQHEGDVSKQLHDSVSKQQHEGSVSKQQHEDGVTKQQHEGSVSKQHEGSVSKQHEGSVSKQQHEDSVTKQQHKGSVSKQHEGSVSKQQHEVCVSKQQHENDVLTPSDIIGPVLPVNFALSPYTKNEIATITNLKNRSVDEILGKMSVTPTLDDKRLSTTYLGDNGIQVNYHRQNFRYYFVGKTSKEGTISGTTSKKQQLGDQVCRKTSQKQYLGNKISRKKCRANKSSEKSSQSKNLSGEILGKTSQMELMVNDMQGKVQQGQNLGCTSSKVITRGKRRKDKNLDKSCQESCTGSKSLEVMSCGQPDTAKITVGTASAVCSGAVMDLTKPQSSRDPGDKSSNSCDGNSDNGPIIKTIADVDCRNVSCMKSARDDQIVNSSGVGAKHLNKHITGEENKHITGEEHNVAGIDPVDSDPESRIIKKQISDLKCQIEHLKADIISNHGYMEADDNNLSPNCPEECMIVAVESGTSWGGASETDNGDLPREQGRTDRDNRDTPLDLTTPQGGTKMATTSFEPKNMPYLHLLSECAIGESYLPQTETVQEYNTGKSEKVVRKKKKNTNKKKKKKGKKILNEATVLKTVSVLEETSSKKRCDEKSLEPRQQDLEEENKQQRENVTEKKISKTHSMTLDKCEVCGESFTSAILLLIHMREHAGEQNHQCALCGKGFTLSGALKHHMQKHKEKELMKCRICGKWYASKYAFKRHCIGHESTNLQKRKREMTLRYKCKMCNEEFRLRSQLIKHNKVHVKGFKCDVCDKILTTKSSLVRHLEQHSATKSVKKRYKCKICARMLGSLKSLSKHSKLHKKSIELDSSKPQLEQCKRRPKRQSKRSKRNPKPQLKRSKVHKEGQELDDLDSQLGHTRTQKSVSGHIGSQESPSGHTASMKSQLQHDGSQESLSGHIPSVKSHLWHTGSQILPSVRSSMESQLGHTSSQESPSGHNASMKSQLQHTGSHESLSGHIDSSESYLLQADHQESPSGYTSNPKSHLGHTASLESPSAHTGSLESPSGHTTSLESPSGHIASLESPSGHTTSLESPSGHTTSLESPSGHIASLESPSGHIASLESPSGHIASLESPSGHTASLESPSGHTASLESPSGHTASLESRPSGHTASQEPTSGHTTSLKSPSGHTGSLESPSGHTGSLESPSGHTSRSKSQLGQADSQESSSGHIDSLESQSEETDCPESQLRPTDQLESNLEQTDSLESLSVHTGSHELQSEHDESPLEHADLEKQFEHTEGEKEDIYTCDICSKTFDHIENLEAHQRTHQAKDVYECILCKKMFLKQCYLDRHYKYHSGEQYFSCDLCDEGFDKKKELLHHQFTVHNKRMTYSYSCSTCSRVFKSHKSFRTHMSCHLKTLKTTSQDEQQKSQEQT